MTISGLLQALASAQIGDRKQKKGDAGETKNGVGQTSSPVSRAGSMVRDG